MAEKTEKPVAAVTGAARGIGRGVSLALAKAGFAVAACATRGEDDAGIAAYAAELKSSGEAFYMKTDISDGEDRRRFIDTVYEKYGRLDVLVNNAGVAPAVRADLLDMEEKSFDRLININLRGAFFLTQYAAKKMIVRQTDSPRSIIFITSISADTASVNRGEYCISKAGLSMAASLFAARLAEYKINVYEIRPSIIETDMIATVKQKYDRLIDGGLLPIKRMGRPDDIAKAVITLAKGYFPYSTGQVFNIDGGFHVPRL